MDIKQFIVRWRWAWFALVGLMMCLCYNGQWQIGPDSAAYRQLGHQLASKKGYVFREKAQGVSAYNDETTSRYPGFPLLLAGVEKIFGSCDWAPLLLMQIITLLTLGVSYQLLRRRFEPWLAVSVVVGMGINARFLQYANELLTEMPFLLGLVTALWGYEKLLHSRQRRGALAGLGWAFAGMLLAAMMRPAFWFVALALLGACLWGMFTGRQGLRRDTEILPRSQARLRFGALLAAMVLAGLLFLLVLDLRTKGSIFGGGYEQRFLAKLEQIKSILFSQPAAEGRSQSGAGAGNPLQNLCNMCEVELPVAVFGTRLGPMFLHWRIWLGGTQVNCGFGLGSLFSLLVLGSGIALGWRNLAWGLLVLVTALALVIWGAIPRYFIMLLPLLLAGWGLIVNWAAGHGRKAGTALMCVGLGVVVFINLGVGMNLARVQRGLTIPVTRNPLTRKLQWTGFHQIGFLVAYHDGYWVKVVELAQMLRHLPASYDKLIGPEPTVLTYLSGRQVYLPAAAIPQQGDDPGINFGFFPLDGHWKIIREYDNPLAELLHQGRLICGKEIANVHQEGGYALHRMQVVPPPPRPERHEHEYDDFGEPRERTKHMRGDDQDNSESTTQPASQSRTPSATEP